MSSALNGRSRLLSGVAILAIGALALAGCSGDNNEADKADTDDTAASSAPSEKADDSAEEEEAADEGEWPRTFTNADGTTTEIPAKPTSIVSTSVSVTGTLLAFDAPVVAAGSAGNGQFFAQWADVAEERGVENLWSAGEVDIEAVYTYEPDLIIVSASGADSVADNVAELQAAAPTIVVDYGGQTWQELAEEIGGAIGMEAEAEKAVADYDAYVADAAEKITPPEGSVNIISFNGAGENNPIARKGSAQGLLISELGFTLEDPPVEWHTQGGTREDFVWASYENLTQLTAETTLILSQDNEGAKGFLEDPTLANLPSVKNGQVYGLGINSFRIDKYSAMEIVDGLVENFGK